MKKKSRKKMRRGKEEKAFLLSATQAVLSLAVCVMFFISGIIFDNSELKAGLHKMIRENGFSFSGILKIKDEIPPEIFDDILGRAFFTSSAFESVPLKDNITSPFGMRINPVLNKKEFHRGIDIRAAEGQRIGAAYFGKCTETGENRIDGKFVVLEHGNFKTKYCHLSRILTEEGMNLKEGEVLGLAGATGLATGSHLHFEIIKDGKYIDPVSAFFREREHEI